MTAQHTPGQLKQRTGYPMDIVGPDEHYAFARAMRVTTPDNAEANARRLVACWNACEGITTDELEEIAVTGGMLGPREDVARIAKQRDELLESLESIMEMLDDEIQTSTDEQLAFGLADPACPDHIKSELKCVIACRAAIAKAGGAA